METLPTYIVRWSINGNHLQAGFPGEGSLDRATMFYDSLLSDDIAEDIWILRAGLNYETEVWIQNKYKGKQPKERKLQVQTGRNKVTRITGELGTVDSAWVIPLGYVDGDADRHGPVVYVPLTELNPALTDTQKAEWSRNNKMEDRTCLWM